MKNLFFSLCVIVIFLGCFTGSYAKDYKYKPAQVEFILTESWDVDSEDDMMIVTVPKENDSLIFSIINTTVLENAFEQVKPILEKKFQNVQITEPQEITINNLAGYSFDAVGEIKGTKIIINADLLITPASKTLFFYGFGDSGTMKKHHFEIDKIVKSIRPIK